MKIHPHDKVLEQLILSLPEREKDVVFHLARCAYCRARLYYLPRPQEAPASEKGAGRYAAALERTRGRVESWALAVEQERDEAPDLFVELMGRPAGRREEILGTDPRFHSWGLFELLIERSRETTTRDAAWAEDLGLLALGLSERLDASRYGAELIEDLRARAWACVGNACRSRSDFDGAEEAFGKSFHHLERGTGDALERGLLLDLLGSLRRDQREFEAAVDLLRKAVSIFLKIGDRHRAGRSLVNMSIVHSHSGQTEESIPVLYQALDLIDAEQEPRLLLCARHNLTTYLADSGRFLEARDLYRETRPLYREFGEPWVQNRRHWVRAKIAGGLGNAGRAESLLLAAREGFLAEGIPFDTALVSLEIAALYAGQGRTADLKRLAEEIVPVFASRHIHREALAALAFLKQAMEAETASLDLVLTVAAYLRRAENDPALKFEASR
ncbi:MAG TPA: tetratricopeptide repeat protein [Thermoanaerobaculia bacterium]|nr:tetratricopeptide repeat protein [Thermoanaerobaculia bacterium]